MLLSNQSCTIVDVGCRYGIHPTWEKLKAIKYFGIDFDLDNKISYLLTRLELEGKDLSKKELKSIQYHNQ